MLKNLTLLLILWSSVVVLAGPGLSELQKVESERLNKKMSALEEERSCLMDATTFEEFNECIKKYQKSSNDTQLPLQPKENLPTK